MADPLYLSIWFPSFGEAEILDHLLCVARLFPASAEQPGITNLTVRPISWNEPTVLERRFRPGAAAEDVIAILREFAHDDYAYELETAWDLWAPDEAGVWRSRPRPVRLIARGDLFDDGASAQEGHIQLDFGLDTPFLYEEVQLTLEIEDRVRVNIQKLVAFSAEIEKQCRITARVLWSESEENLAQKLIARLQQVQ